MTLSLKTCYDINYTTTQGREWNRLTVFQIASQVAIEHVALSRLKTIDANVSQNDLALAA